MNINELIQLYENDNNPIINRIAKIINDWKLSDKDIDDFVYVIEKYFGNTWIEDEKEHDRNYRF